MQIEEITQNNPQHEDVRINHEDLRIKVLVQPNSVQVKRVGRASCIEPELKVCLEYDALYPIAVTLNAYLKVLSGKDNKHKMILLRKSDEIMMTKIHRREMVNMKLRFLKNIKVQVLKRNLGVVRPEAFVVFEAVNRHGDVLASMSTNQFAIISDPRYLDDVKKRAVKRRTEAIDSDDDSYQPPTIKRIRLSPIGEYEGPLNNCDASVPLLANKTVDTISYDSSPVPSISPPSSPSSPMASPSLSSPTPIYLTPLQTLKDTSDFELFADSEEEYKLIKLVESLKYRGCTQQMCNFQVLPPAVRT